MDLYQVDVFSSRPFAGNPLAVVPDVTDLKGEQMQAIASEMNLSETTFVTSATEDSYQVKIFTPKEELPFAGHPTIGTAWILRHLGALTADRVVQTSRAGETMVTFSKDEVFFEREGKSEDDLTAKDSTAVARLARALSVAETDIGLEARELGRSGLLEPAFSDAGVRQLMVPVTNVAVLGRVAPRAELLHAAGWGEVYCFTAEAAGRLRARAFFPGIGIAEDPGTGSAGAALGIYLARRIGAVDAQLVQGVEMGRPCVMNLKAEDSRARVGGRCALVMKASLQALP
jgi:trans-2,3-dihydro-3-hydroxyanthranilate isomerase